jgi:hypothetical protein
VEEVGVEQIQINKVQLKEETLQCNQDQHLQQVDLHLHRQQHRQQEHNKLHN